MPEEKLVGDSNIKQLDVEASGLNWAVFCPSQACWQQPSSIRAPNLRKFHAVARFVLNSWVVKCNSWIDRFMLASAGCSSSKWLQSGTALGLFVHACCKRRAYRQIHLAWRISSGATLPSGELLHGSLLVHAVPFHREGRE